MQYLIQKLPRLLIAILLVVSMLAPVVALTPAGAAPTSGDNTSTGGSGSGGSGADTPGTESTGTGAGGCISNENDPAYTTNPCPKSGDPAARGKCATPEDCDVIKRFVQPAVNLLATAFGLIITISLVVGGIQLGSSAGDPQKAAAAKGRITNAVIALVAFILLYGALNFLIPGGLL